MPYEAPTYHRYYDQPHYLGAVPGPGHPQGPSHTRRQRRAIAQTLDRGSPHWTDNTPDIAEATRSVLTPPPMPIPPTPDLMNTIPPGVPGIDPRVPLQPPSPHQMPVPMNTHPNILNNEKIIRALLR